MNKLPDNTQSSFSVLLQQIQQVRQKAFTQVNAALIDLYWQVGKTISDKVQNEAWGKGVVSELARYIALHDPTIKGFSDKNLWRMKQFYETYQADEKLVPLVKELPWTHNFIIFSRCKTTQERTFYLQLTTTDKLSKRDLERQIDSSQFERSMMGAILSPVVRELHPHISNTFKDSYALSRNLSPTLIAQYQLQLPDKKLIQAKLHELYANEDWETQQEGEL